MLRLFTRRRARKATNHRLTTRPDLARPGWQALYAENIPPAIVDFVLDSFEGYSGINFARVRPFDRMEADLQFSAACFADWDLDLYEDFEHRFGRDLRNCGLPKGDLTVDGWIRLIAACATEGREGLRID